MQTIEVGHGSFIIGERIEIGRDVSVGSNTVIRATSCMIEDGVHVGSDNKFLVGDSLDIGSNTVIHDRNEITGRSVAIGEYGYWESDIVVGQGGAFGPDSRLRVGAYSMICDRVILNLSEHIDIGSFVGIGNEVNIWTHGAFLPVTEGFPAAFGPVEIGDKVWLPSRSIVLPNRKIGNNVVIGIASLVNRDIPDGALAAGAPIRIIDENRYPSGDTEAISNEIAAAVDAYHSLADYKKIESDVAYDPNKRVITCNAVVFDLDRMVVQGALGPIEQDFRDYLRRRGIKFYTGDAFESVTPPNIARLLSVDLESGL